MLVLVALGATIWWQWGRISTFAPALRIRDVAANWWDNHCTSLPHASGDRFAIGIADIEGDSDGVIKQLLVESLSGLDGTERLAIDRTIRTRNASNPTDAEARSQRIAQDWLNASDANLLIWGRRVDSDPPRVRLFFTAGHSVRGSGTIIPIQEALELTETAQDVFEAAVKEEVIAYLSQFAPAAAVSRQLRPAVDRMSKLAWGHPAGATRTFLLSAVADAKVVDGQQTSDEVILRESIEASRKALEGTNRNTSPLAWIAAQESLGRSLVAFGEAAGSESSLDEAVGVLTVALAERDRNGTPLVWAATRNELGRAILGLGLLRTDAERLAEAASTFRDALKERKRDIVPLEWAETMNDLGRTLYALGTLERDPSQFKEAETALNEALEVRSRERTPVYWATTMKNRGALLTAWGTLEKDKNRLEKSVVVLREALQEVSLRDVPAIWTACQLHLANALQTHGTLQIPAALSVEALDRCREVISIIDPSRTPALYADTQTLLADMLSDFGRQEGGNFDISDVGSRRDSGTQRLIEATAAYNKASATYLRGENREGWCWAQLGLADSIREIGERHQGVDRARWIQESISIYRGLLESNSLREDSEVWPAAQLGLGRALYYSSPEPNEVTHIEESAAAFRAAMTVWTRDRNPSGWANAQLELSVALNLLGSRRRDAALLDQAEFACRSAQEVWNRHEFPVDWAVLQFVLGGIHLSRGGSQPRIEHWKMTIAAYQDALAALEPYPDLVLTKSITSAMEGCQRSLASREAQNSRSR